MIKYKVIYDNLGYLYVHPAWFDWLAKNNPYDVLGKHYEHAPAQEKTKQPTVGQMSRTAYRAMKRDAWGR